MRKLYAQFISPGDLCFDVGANEGNRTSLFLKLGGKVVAVEPQADYAQKLRSRYSGNRHVVVVEKALGESPGSLEIMVSSIGTLSSLSQEWINHVKKSGRFDGVRWDKKVLVPVTTLDQLIQTLGTPSFCKVDVEGFELQVLRGLSCPIPAISFEFTPEYLTPTLEAIRHLSSLGNYVFNYSEGESMLLSMNTWVSAELVESTLVNIPDKRVFGDVYARLGDRANRHDGDR